MTAIPFVKVNTKEYEMVDISDIDKNMPSERICRLETSDGKPIDNVKVSVHIVLNLVEKKILKS